MKSLFRLRKNYEETLKEMNNLRKKLEEKDDYIDTLEKQVNFAAQYNDKVTNNNCELVNKLAVSDRKNEENEKKIKDLEFCLEECKIANRKMTDIVKRTNIFKSQLEDMLLIRNKEGKMTIVDGKIQVNKKIDGVKCYEVVRLLG